MTPVRKLLADKTRQDNKTKWSGVELYISGKKIIHEHVKLVVMKRRTRPPAWGLLRT